jgi:flagellar hook-basal body complex protein FliE
MDITGVAYNSLFSTTRMPGLDALENRAAPQNAAGAGTPDVAFTSILDKAVGRVDDLQQSADIALEGLASGRNVDLHGTMIALEHADIALRAAVSVRDKFVQAYEQIMNMAV